MQGGFQGTGEGHMRREGACCQVPRVLRRRVLVRKSREGMGGGAGGVDSGGGGVVAACMCGPCSERRMAASCIGRAQVGCRHMPNMLAAGTACFVRLAAAHLWHVKQHDELPSAQPQAGCAVAGLHCSTPEQRQQPDAWPAHPRELHRLRHRPLQRLLRLAGLAGPCGMLPLLALLHCHHEPHVDGGVCLWGGVGVRCGQVGGAGCVRSPGACVGTVRVMLMSCTEIMVLFKTYHWLQCDTSALLMQ